MTFNIKIGLQHPTPKRIIYNLQLRKRNKDV